MNEQEIKEQLCDICHKMWQLGWVAANDGIGHCHRFCTGNALRHAVYR